MSQAKLDAMIVKPELKVIERDHVEPRPILAYHDEYDSLHPEETIRNFCSSIRDMMSRYEFDKERLSALEQEMQDVLHFIEMTKDKNANLGYKLYKKLCEIRRERRVCKNEIDLLRPVYEGFHGHLDRLTNIQGECRQAKQAIANKAYTVRTDVLEEFLE